MITNSICQESGRRGGWHHLENTDSNQDFRSHGFTPRNQIQTLTQCWMPMGVLMVDTGYTYPVTDWGWFGGVGSENVCSGTEFNYRRRRHRCCLWWFASHPFAEEVYRKSRPWIPAFMWFYCFVEICKHKCGALSLGKFVRGNSIDFRFQLWQHVVLFERIGWINICAGVCCAAGINYRWNVSKKDWVES